MAANLPAGVSAQASENNQRLFRRYAKVFFDTNQLAYITHAEKLSLWLHDYKAYYTAARPEIVKLLLIAHATLRRAVGLDDIKKPFNASDYPGDHMVEAYTLMIKTVEPFQTYFVEPGLLAHIKFLLATITPLSSAPVPSPQDGTTLPIVPSQSMSPPVQTNPEEQIVESSKATPLLPGTTPTQVIGPSSTNDMVATSSATTAKKVKKRKTIDFDRLVQHDIKGLLQKKEIQNMQPSTIVASQIDTPLLKGSPSTHPENLSEQTIPATEAVPIEADSAHVSPNLDDRNGQENIGVPPEQVSVPTKDGHTPPIDTGMAIEGTGESPHDEVITQPMEQSFSVVDEPTPIPIDVDRAESVVPDTFSETLLATLSLSGSAPPSEVEPIQNIPASPCISDPTQNVPSTIEIEQVPGASGSKMRIVASQQGLKENGRISVQFDIDEAEFRAVMNWIDGAQDVLSSICFTLGCYLQTADLFENAKTEESMTFEAQLSATRSTWPTHGGLIMNTNFNNTREDLPLSPPFQLTPDNLVDVSPFLVLGRNVIELNQRQDLSQYTFVLRAHLPTQAQLKQIEERKHKDKQWEEWLHRLSRPLSPFLIPVM